MQEQRELSLHKCVVYRGVCRKRFRGPEATHLSALSACTTFLFVTSQPWLGLPPHGPSPRRSCRRLVLHLDRLHLVSCPSFKLRFRTGDWLPKGSDTPQVHAHAGRTRARGARHKIITNGNHIGRPR